MRIADIAPPDYRDFEGLDDKEANQVHIWMAGGDNYANWRRGMI